MTVIDLTVFWLFKIEKILLIKLINVTYIQACIEQNMSECLCLAQNGINQDDHWIIFNVLVHWLLAGLLWIDRQAGCVSSRCFLVCIGLTSTLLPPSTKTSKVAHILRPEKTPLRYS